MTEKRKTKQTRTRHLNAIPATLEVIRLLGGWEAAMEAPWDAPEPWEVEALEKDIAEIEAEQAGGNAS